MYSPNNIEGLKIFSDWILCEPIKEELEEIDGLAKPTSYEERVSKAKVVIMGNEIKKPIKIGDIIVFNQFAPIIFNWKNTDYLILKEEDCLGSFEEEKI